MNIIRYCYLGDAQYKPYVTAKPEHATVDLDGDEDFVVVACDGLWDFVSEDDVALSVYRQIGADPGKCYVTFSSKWISPNCQFVSQNDFLMYSIGSRRC